MGSAVKVLAIPKQASYKVSWELDPVTSLAGGSLSEPSVWPRSKERIKKEAGG